MSTGARGSPQLHMSWFGDQGEAHPGQRRGSGCPFSALSIRQEVDWKKKKQPWGGKCKRLHWGELATLPPPLLPPPRVPLLTPLDRGRAALSVSNRPSIIHWPVPLFALLWAGAAKIWDTYQHREWAWGWGESAWCPWPGCPQQPVSAVGHHSGAVGCSPGWMC